MSKEVDRRISILNATIRLLSEKGLTGVTHRAVDEAAGIPQGSTTYYFPKKQLLLESAAEQLAELMDESCASVKLVFAELIAEGKRDEAIDQVASDLLDFTDDERVLLLARFELALAGSRDPTLRHIADRLTDSARKPIEFFLRLLVEDISEQQVDMCMGLLDGLAILNATQQGPKPTIEQVKRIFLSA